MTFLAVLFGGAIGSALRYWISLLVDASLGTGFPFGTLTVNVLGSLLIGFADVILNIKFQGNDYIRLFLIVGMLGGFTTFSSFSIETINLIHSGLVLKAALNVFVSLITCIGAVFIGIEIAKFSFRI